MCQLQGHLRRGTCWRRYPRNHSQQARQAMRGERDLVGRTVRIPAPMIDHRHDVCGTPTTGFETGDHCPTEHGLQKPAEGLRVHRPRAPAENACPIQNPAESDKQYNGRGAYLFHEASHIRSLSMTNNWTLNVQPQTPFALNCAPLDTVATL